jgi:hypothetical protein
MENDEVWVPLPRLSDAETRRRLLLVCQKLKIDPDGPEAAALAGPISRQADISILEPSG